MIVFWDTAGQERFRSANIKCIRSVNGIILVFDFTDRTSFEHLEIWLREIRNNFPDDTVIVLFGNKIDIEKDKWEVTSEEASKFAEKYHFAYFETSAKTRQGINEGLSYLVNAIYDKIMGIDEKDKVMDINDIKKSNKNSNCAGNKNGKNNKK